MLDDKAISELMNDAVHEIFDRAKEAVKAATREGIKANTIVINSNMVKVSGEPGLFPDMICGLNVRWTADELPDNYSFAVCNNPYIENDVKELHEFSVGGNLLDKEHGCIITMYNEDESGNEYDSVYIQLSPKQVIGLIDDLLMFLPESYKRSM